VLVYAAREWSGLSVKELGRRLYAGYVEQRTSLLEKRVQAISRK